MTPFEVALSFVLQHEGGYLCWDGPSSWSSSIVGLLYSRAPLAVGWFVVAVVVFAIKCESLRPWTHVSKKALEVQPALANRNTASAVVRKCLTVRIETSALHGGPYSIFRRPVRSVRSSSVSVAKFTSTRDFAIKAAAAFDESTPQIVSSYNFPISAIAKAQPVGVLA